MREPLLYRLVRPLVSGFVKLIYRPNVVGSEYIPRESRVVLAGNHTSYLDCILLMSTTKRVIHFLAKDSLIKGPKKIIFKNMGIIPVNRSIKDKSVLKNAEDILNSERVIGIFPEGTINKSDDLTLKFKIGAVKMAHDTLTDIIPFSITGKYTPFKNNLTIKFHEPFKVSNEDLEYENERLRDIIERDLKGTKR